MLVCNFWQGHGENTPRLADLDQPGFTRRVFDDAVRACKPALVRYGCREVTPGGGVQHLAVPRQQLHQLGHQPAIGAAHGKIGTAIVREQLFGVPARFGRVTFKHFLPGVVRGSVVVDLPDASGVLLGGGVAHHAAEDAPGTPLGVVHKTHNFWLRPVTVGELDHAHVTHLKRTGVAAHVAHRHTRQGGRLVDAQALGRAGVVRKQRHVSGIGLPLNGGNGAAPVGGQPLLPAGQHRRTPESLRAALHLAGGQHPILSRGRGGGRGQQHQLVFSGDLNRGHGACSVCGQVSTPGAGRFLQGERCPGGRIFGQAGLLVKQQLHIGAQGRGAALFRLQFFRQFGVAGKGCLDIRWHHRHHAGGGHIGLDGSGHRGLGHGLNHLLHTQRVLGRVQLGGQQHLARRNGSQAGGFGGLPGVNLDAVQAIGSAAENRCFAHGATAARPRPYTHQSRWARSN